MLHFCLSRRPWRCYSSQRRKSGTCLSCCRESSSWETSSLWLPEERRSPPSKVGSRVMRVWKCETKDKCVFSIFVWLSVVTNASELLGLDAFQLSEVLTQRSIILRGEEICSPLTIEQVRNTYIYSPSTSNTQKPIPTHLFPVAGHRFQRLCCHGVIFPVFLLDHPQNKSED